MGAFKRFWGRWKCLARALGDFQARIFLTIIYAVLVLPFGLVVRLFSDALKTKRRPTAWLDYPPISTDLEKARRQG
jgi:hypothetical protein